MVNPPRIPPASSAVRQREEAKIRDRLANRASVVYPSFSRPNVGLAAAAAAAPSSAVVAPVTSTSATVAPRHKRKYQATSTDHVDKDSTVIAEPSSSKRQKVNDDEKIEHVSSDQKTDNVQSKHTSAVTEKTITEKTVEKEFKQISSSKKEHNDNRASVVYPSFSRLNAPLAAAAAAAAAAPSSAVVAPVTSTSATVAPEHKRKYQATNTDHVDKDRTVIVEPSSSKKQKVNDDEKIEHVSSDQKTDNVQSKPTSAVTEKTITEKTVDKEFKQISSSKREDKDNELENDTSNKQNSKDKQPERAASGKPESTDKEPECKALKKQDCKKNNSMQQPRANTVGLSSSSLKRKFAGDDEDQVQDNTASARPTKRLRFEQEAEPSNKRKHVEEPRRIHILGDGTGGDPVGSDGAEGVLDRPIKKMRTVEADKGKGRAIKKSPSPCNTKLGAQKGQAGKGRRHIKAPATSKAAIYDCTHREVVVHNPSANVGTKYHTEYNMRINSKLLSLFERAKLVDIVPERGRKETLVFAFEATLWEVTWEKPRSLSTATTKKNGPAFNPSKADAFTSIEGFYIYIIDGLKWYVSTDVPMYDTDEMEDISEEEEESDLHSSELSDYIDNSEDEQSVTANADTVDAEDDAISIKSGTEAEDDDDVPVIQSEAVRNEGRPRRPRYLPKITTVDSLPGEQFYHSTAIERGPGNYRKWEITEQFTLLTRKERANATDLERENDDVHRSYISEVTALMTPEEKKAFLSKQLKSKDSAAAPSVPAIEDTAGPSGSKTFTPSRRSIGK